MIIKSAFDFYSFSPQSKQLFRGRRRIMISWHRFYDPETGRYITADPIGLAGGMNLYAYVGGDPVNWVDTFGLKPGDLFDSKDAAAFDAIDYSMPFALSDGVEYGGYLYKTCEGKYSYVEPTAGEYKKIDPSKFNPIPDGTTKVGIYHTHNVNDNKAPFFSPEDDWVAGREKVDMYLGTSTGFVKKREYFYMAPSNRYPIRKSSAKIMLKYINNRPKR